MKAEYGEWQIMFASGKQCLQVDNQLYKYYLPFVLFKIVYKRDAYVDLAEKKTAHALLSKIY